MKFQGYIATARSLLGGHKMVFGFVVLPFIGVVLFPSPCLMCNFPRPLRVKLLTLFLPFFFFFFDDLREY